MKCQVAIVGGGGVGNSLAVALARARIEVVLVDPGQPRLVPADGFDSRVFALNGQSRHFLEEQRVWQRMNASRIAPVRDMRIFGDAASVLEFDAYRSGLPELAAIVEDANLQHALRSAVAASDGLTLVAGACESFRSEGESARVALVDGTQIEAQLVVAADGARSALREAAGIQAHVHDYGQIGVVANFLAAKAHRDTAFQWFGEHGVLALLPLPAGNVSMVWSAPEQTANELMSLPGAELASRVESVSKSALGELRQNSPVMGFPLRRMHVPRLIGPRLALVGDTAHNVHPLAGQGLNLGFADAQRLAEVLASRGAESDCGAPATLRRYERSRREDVLAMELVTDGLVALFGSRLPGARRLRNTGLNLTNRFSSLKRLLVKHAMG